jgi:hypothetical protein
VLVALSFGMLMGSCPGLDMCSMRLMLQLPTARLVEAAREISSFLRAFVSETEPSLKRVWRTKQYLQACEWTALAHSMTANAFIWLSFGSLLFFSRL